MFSAADANQPFGTSTPAFVDPEADLIQVRNDDGLQNDFDRFGCCGYADPLIVPEDGEENFVNHEPVYSGELLDHDQHHYRFAVPIEPILASDTPGSVDGSIGKAIVRGVTFVRVTVTNKLHTHARPITGDATQLETGFYGHASILYLEPPTASEPDPTDAAPLEKWALVILEDQSGFVVRGYLRQFLPSAFASATDLNLTWSPVAVYSLDANRDWVHLGESVVWNYDEGLEGPEGAYFKAKINADGVLEPEWVSCGPTALILPPV